MIFIGIDPGKKGAIALIYPNEHGVDIEAIPIVSGNGSKDEYDVGAVALYMLKLQNAHRSGSPMTECFAVMEKPQPIPPIVKAGSLAQFNRGVQFGFAWMLEALRIPYQLVAPRTWQRVMLEGTPGDDTKQRSILAAQRLFPGVDLRRTERSRKADNGFSDALLLAEYARRIRNGGSR